MGTLSSANYIIFRYIREVRATSFSLRVSAKGIILMKQKSNIILLSLLGCALQAMAQPDERGFKKAGDTATAKGNIYAIIVGISDYKLVPDLQYAHKDAQSFESFLLSEGGGKVPATNIETFLNENATRTNVGDAISVLARKAKPGDRVYFFFAGHGDMEDLTQIENGLLLLHNSPNGNYFGMNDDVLEILDLKRYLSPLAQRGIEMIFIVDACHSGNLKGGVEGVQQTASALTAAWGKEYKILSCQPNQLSLESSEWGGGRGLFSLQLEEGLKGLADMDNNGTVSMFELQSYIQSNVAKYSEGKQIPLVTGDLSKPISKVNPTILAALKLEKAKNYPILASANTKGNDDKYVDSLDPAGKKLYASFKSNIAEKRLVAPIDTNAFRDYRLFEKKYPASPLVVQMRRNLAAVLNEKFNGIVSPLLKGQRSYSSREECGLVAIELDSSMQLLGSQHYMYTNIKARKLFMDAMALSWALSENEYNAYMKPAVETSVKLLEQSEQLEPNAAYTLDALGVRYIFLYENDKATKAFQKYLDLRPNDLMARYTLGITYANLKMYDNAEKIFEELLKENPGWLDVGVKLSDVYLNNKKSKNALAIINAIIDTSTLYKGNGYFFKGVYYSRSSMTDSAIYYYNLAKKEMGACDICDNNIGHNYFVNNQLDSAKKYFRRLLEADSLNVFANFNMGTIEVLEGDIGRAFQSFVKSAVYAPAFMEGYVNNLQLYFGKTYTATDVKEFKQFKETQYIFNMQYLSYLSILYGYMRDSAMLNKGTGVQYFFDQAFVYKQHDVYTWYHHACYKSLIKDKQAALASLENALRLGYGNYFTLLYDGDLAFVRTAPEFKNLLKKYFPKESAAIN